MLAAGSSEDDVSGERRSLIEGVALVVTYVLSPPVLVPMLLWLIVGWVGAPVEETVILVSAGTFMTGVVPAAFLFWMVWSGRSRTVNLEDRRDRTRALGVSIVAGLGLLFVVILVSATARELVIGMTLAYMFGIGLLAAVNRYWRISLHAASAAAFASVVVFLVVNSPVRPALDPLGATAALAGAATVVALVCWSRWRLRAHSVGQLVAGALLGFVVPYAVLSVLGVL